MGHITTYNLSGSGVAPTFAAATDTDSADVGDGLYLEVRNSGAQTTVTLTCVPTLVTGVVMPNRAYTVPAGPGGELRIPLLSSAYRNATDGYAHFAWADKTNITRAVVNYKR